MTKGVYVHRSPNENTRRKMSLALKGRKNSVEHNLHISMAKKGKSNLKLRGRHFSEETKRRMSSAQRLYFMKHPEARKRISLAHKGQTPWDKGLHGVVFLRHFKSGYPFLGRHHTRSTRILMSKNSAKAMLGNHHSEESKKKISVGMKKYFLNPKSKLNASLKHIGKKHSKESILKMKMHNWSKRGYKPSMLGRHLNEKTKRLMSLLGKRKSPESIRKSLERRIPTSLEAEGVRILNKHSQPYKFTGDGSFFIEKYNPDFINTNGQKIVLEFYARYFKRLHGSIDSWKQKRRRVYGKYGYKVLFFNEAQTNEKYIMKRLSSLS
jgi:hypothetical protein